MYAHRSHSPKTMQHEDQPAPYLPPDQQRDVVRGCASGEDGLPCIPLHVGAARKDAAAQGRLKGGLQARHQLQHLRVRVRVQ